MSIRNNLFKNIIRFSVVSMIVCQAYSPVVVKGMGFTYNKCGIVSSKLTAINDGVIKWTNIEQDSIKCGSLEDKIDKNVKGVQNQEEMPIDMLLETQQVAAPQRIKLEVSETVAYMDDYSMESKLQILLPSEEKKIRTKKTINSNKDAKASKKAERVVVKKNNRK